MTTDNDQSARAGDGILPAVEAQRELLKRLRHYGDNDRDAACSLIEQLGADLYKAEGRADNLARGLADAQGCISAWVTFGSNVTEALGLQVMSPKAILAEIARLLAAAPAAAPAWQPIETAPRGSGMDGPGNTTHPDYIEPPTLLLWTQEGPRVGYYDWYYHPGYGRGADPHESPWRCAEGGQAYVATHWMPLPAAPAVLAVKDRT